MRISEVLRQVDINEGMKKYRDTKDAVLLDVRTAWEYGEGHIPGSGNMPLQDIGLMARSVEKDIPLFVYCQSGARSRKAASLLKYMGYRNVSDIGGIAAYEGMLVR